VVKEGYAAFGRGDIAGLLALMADDVEWTSPGTGLPMSGTYRGVEGVGKFFQKLIADFEILDFQPREFVADGERVLVIGAESVKVRATNRIANLEWVMSFTVRNGKVVNFSEYTDTKAIAEAYQAATGASA
jgi:ketosteroid isomerase-like protein